MKQGSGTAVYVAHYIDGAKGRHAMHALEWAPWALQYCIVVTCVAVHTRSNTTRSGTVAKQARVGELHSASLEMSGCCTRAMAQQSCDQDSGAYLSGAYISGCLPLRVPTSQGA